MTFIQAATATAASAALPPLCRIRRPASAASGWPHATQPCGDNTGERVVKDIANRAQNSCRCGFLKDPRKEFIVGLDMLSPYRIISPLVALRGLRYYRFMPDLYNCMMYSKRMSKDRTRDFLSKQYTYVVTVAS